MKYFYLFISFILCMGPFKVEALSSCHQNCFEAKASCNKINGHTLNSCGEQHWACKASCSSGKPHEVYHNTPTLEVAFNPILEGKDLMKKVLGG